MRATVNPEQLKHHVYHLAGEIGERNIFNPAALDAAADYIRQNWNKQGYQVIQQAYSVNGVQCANLECCSEGSTRKDMTILIGAHYDSVSGAPGADDNGSGVAALLVLSDLFSSMRPQTNLRFVAFVNEEPPFFMTRQQGSRIYAKAARQRGDNIGLAIVLEMLGYYCSEPGSQRYPPFFRYFYPDRGNFIAFVSNFRSRSLMRQLVAAFRASTDFPCQHVATFAQVPGVGWSDHLSFWQQGYRALMITDTAFYRYPYYHTAQDTPDKLDYERFAQVTNGLFRAVYRLSSELV